MIEKTACVAHIQKVVNLLHEFEQWENKAFVEALSLGIQGKKREARYEGTADTQIKKYLQSEAFDLFGEKIFPSAVETSFTQTGIESFLEEYRTGLWSIYSKLHEAANVFVSPLCLRDLANPLYDRTSCIKCAITDLNRKIKRYADMKREGTALHDLFIYETSDFNNHDEAEKMEAQQGYKY